MNTKAKRASALGVYVGLYISSGSSGQGSGGGGDGSGNGVYYTGPSHFLGPRTLLPPADSGPFKRVLAYFSPTGETTRVEWELSNRFIAPEPLRFQLQFAYTDGRTAQTWENVGLEVEDAAYLEDDEKRLFGRTPEAYYRVRVTTADNKVFHSQAVSILSAQDWRDWRTSRSILRQETKRNRLVAVEGYLLRRKRYGPLCDVCVDRLTDQPVSSRCRSCFGVGRLKGYHPAEPLMVDMSLYSSAETQDDQARGTAKEGADAPHRVSGIGLLNSLDVWVEKRSGQRWSVDQVSQGAATRGQAFIWNVGMSLLPFTDIVYEVPIP